MKKLLGIVVLGLLLNGCAGSGHPLSSKYKPKGRSGGYYEQQIAQNRYQVTYRGNGYTKIATVQNRAMLRAAEFTVEKGKDLFSIILDEEILTEPSGYGTQSKFATTLEIKMYSFTDFIDETNLTKEQYKQKIEDRNNKLGDTNLYIAEDTLKYLDKYRY